MEKPAFDPNQPFEPAPSPSPSMEASAKPAFDPNQAYTPIEASAPPEGPSRLEALGRGTLKSAGWGLQHSAEPFVERGIAKLFGDQQTKDYYDQLSNDRLRQTVDQQNQAAKDAHPGYYLTGEIAGTIPGYAATAGSGSALGIASKAPGAAGTLINAGGRMLGPAALGFTRHFNESDEALLPKLQGSATTGVKEGLMSEIVPEALRRTGQGIQALPAAAKAAFAKLRGISPETLETLINNPEAIKAVEGMGATTPEALQAYAHETAQGLNDARSNFIERGNQNIDARLGTLNADDVRVRAQDLLGAIDSTASDIAPEGIAITPEYQRGLQTLQGVGGRIQSAANQNALNTPASEVMSSDFHYLPESDVVQAEQFPRVSEGNYGSQAPSTANYGHSSQILPVDTIGNEPYLTASQINTMRKQLNSGAKAIYSANAAERLPTAEAYGGLADRTREILGGLDPGINAQNQIFKQGLDAQKSLSRYGFNKNADIDPSRLSNLLTAGPKQAAQNASHMETLDNLWGTDLQDRSTIANSVKELNPEGLWNKVMTGYSNFPLAAAGVGHMLHSPLATGVALGTAGLQSPLLTKPIVRTATALSNNIVTDNTVKPVMNFISEALQSNPAVLGKYGAPLMQAAQRGAGALSATHFVLQQTDPGYREKLEELQNQPGQENQ